MNVVPAASQQSYSFHGHAIRVVLRDGDPWFVASDVAAALDYRDAEKASRSLPDRQKATTRIVGSTSGGNPNRTIVSEGGLYRLVLRSRKPEAEAFTDWVTDEVLPSIRKTGAYATPQAGTVLDDYTIYAVYFLCTHFSALYRIYKDNNLYTHLSGLGSRIGVEMLDHVRDGMAGGVRYLEKTLGDEFKRVHAQFSDRAMAPRVQAEPTIPDTHILVDRRWLKDLKWGVVMMRRMKELMGQMRSDGLPVGAMDACLSHLGGHFIDGTRMILSDAGMEDDAKEVATAFKGGFVQPH